MPTFTRYLFNAASLPYVNAEMQIIKVYDDNTNHVTPDGAQYQVHAGTGNLTLQGDATVIAQPSDEARATIAANLVTYSHERPPAPAQFARAPAQMNREIIDYSTKGGVEIYKLATKPMYDAGTGFNLSPTKKFEFVGKLKTKAAQQGWSNLLTITPLGRPATNLLTQYGGLTEAQVKTRADAIMGTNDRVQQEDQMLYTCVYNSLSPAAQQRISLQPARVQATNGLPSGIMLLKVVLTMSSVDTRASVALLWSKLNSGMPEMMESHGNNVIEFNDEVRLVQSKLLARGEDPTPIVPQLFKVYEDMHKGEGKMGRYVELLANKYTDGTNYTDVTLMEAVEVKYRELMEDSQEKGDKKDDKDSQILAMTAKIAALEAAMTTNQKPPATTKTDDDQPDKDQRRTQARALRRKLDKLPAPKDGESTSTVIDGKTYYWCLGGNGAHKAKWVAHRPTECRARKGAQTPGTNGTQGGSTAKTDDKTPAAGLMAQTMHGYASDEEDIDGKPRQK